MTGFHIKRTWVSGLTVFALCFNILRILPDMHHHEEQHACVGLQGEFFHLETEPHQHTDHSGETIPHLVRVRLGDAHHHELCGLCQFLPSLLDVQAKSHAYGVITQAWRTRASELSLTRNAADHRPRGPPLFI